MLLKRLQFFRIDPPFWSLVPESCELLQGKEAATGFGAVSIQTLLSEVSKDLAAIHGRHRNAEALKAVGKFCEVHKVAVADVEEFVSILKHLESRFNILVNDLKQLLQIWILFDSDTLPHEFLHNDF